MGDLSKLKVAVAQPELVQGQPSLNLATRNRMMEAAIDAGADLLVLPGSLTDASDVHLVALNDTRIDVAGSTVMLEVTGESYRVGVGSCPDGCDFAVYADVDPWSLTDAWTRVDPWLSASSRRADRPGIVLRPVGMRNRGRKVLAYDGGTCVHAADGTPIARLRDDFEEDFAVVGLTEQGPLAQPCGDKLLTALVKTLRRFDALVLGGSPKWVIGLSGGLDSSVVAALLAMALGPERVIGYNLATGFNTQQTKANADSLARALGVPLRQGSISALVTATETVAEGYGYGSSGLPAVSGLALENVQARVRGHVLSTFAALEGGVVVNNGNRVEGAFGYATMYGDAIGALSPIGDVTKVNLFQVARAVNARLGCEAVPENLLPVETADGYDWQLMPSAELAEGQVDPMKWFYHDWVVEQLLDAASVDEGACNVLERYLHDRMQGIEVGKWVRFYGLDRPQAFRDDFDWVMRSLRGSAFKRIQAPPVITVASPASISAEPEMQGPVEASPRYNALWARVRALSD